MRRPGLVMKRRLTPGTVTTSAPRDVKRSPRTASCSAPRQGSMQRYRETHNRCNLTKCCIALLWLRCSVAHGSELAPCASEDSSNSKVMTDGEGLGNG